MIITREIYVTRKTLPNPIEYVQGTNALPIAFTLADYTIPDGSEAKVYVEKPSGYCEYDIAVAAGNVVLIDVKDTMFDEVGTSNIQIKLTKDDKTLITFDYPVKVSKNRVAGNIPQSGDNSDLIDELLRQGTAAVSKANAAADRANAAADRVDGTDVGALAKELDTHTGSQVNTSVGVHGLRFSGGKFEYNSSQEGQPANWKSAITKEQLLDMIYPVGSLYLTTSTAPPGGLFGGSWQLWGKGRTIVGVDSFDTDFSAAEKTGGEKTHKLTIDEMPSHNHDLSVRNEGLEGTAKTYNPPFLYNKQYTVTAYSDKTGGDKPHNNMPPYITCYIWKRTA